MAKKLVSEKDVASYKWVKIIQSTLLIIFGLVLCIFSGSNEVQDALGYITASIILLYGALTIGFGLIFVKGILSIENVTGAALIALSVLIFVNPLIVLEYIALFVGVMLLVFALIFIIETIISLASKNRNKFLLTIFIIASIIFLALGTLTICFNYSNNNEYLKIALIILIGIILIIAGCLLIFYYAANPKFKIDEKVIYSEDGKSKLTVVKTDVYATNKKSKRKKISENSNDINDKNEITEVK